MVSVLALILGAIFILTGWFLKSVNQELSWILMGLGTLQFLYGLFSKGPRYYEWL